MLRAGRGLLVPFLVAAWLLGAGPDSTAPSVDAQSAPVNVAGLVVDYGDGRMSYALIPFADESLSGWELLDRSDLSLLTVAFGGLGAGVCQIEATGCDLDACRARLCQSGDPDSPFWQYAQHRSGEWVTSPLGASTSEVVDGTIDAWSWSSDPPAPAITSLDEIADQLGVDLNDLRSGSATGPIVSPLDDGGDRRMSPGAREIAGAVLLAGIAGAGVLAMRRSRSSPAA